MTTRDITSAEFGTQTLVLNMGPQHPSTHGVLHLRLELSGETIVGITPVIGYLHRGIEKLAENRTYPQVLVLCDRLDYVSQLTNEWAFCRAVERLANIEVPPRAEYARTLLVELTRITSHIIWFSSVGLDLGAWTPFIYAFQEREIIFDFFEETCGARMMTNFLRFGGLREDLEPEPLERMHTWLTEDFPVRVDEWEQLLSGNEIFLSRVRGVGVFDGNDLERWGVTGPFLRASGVARDLRIDDPYGAYADLGLRMCTRSEGDAWARYRLRVDEIRESMRIAALAIERMPEGEFRTKVPKVLRPPEGEVYVRTESPRGELGMYIVSDGSNKPYRFHVRSPVFNNLSALPRMVIGEKIQDMIVIFGGLDTSMGEIDR